MSAPPALIRNVTASPLRGRSCGGCNECCLYGPGVSDVGKEPRERCGHSCASGCAVYADRPTPCRVWYCLWRLGAGTEKDRPDRSGMVLSVTEAVGGLEVVQVYGREPGSIHGTRQRRLLAALSEWAILVDVEAGDLIGAPEEHMGWVQASVLAGQMMAADIPLAPDSAPG